MAAPDPAIVAAFEQACRDAQVATTRPAAERSLNLITARPDAIGIALAVAATTTSAIARFHAAVALRTAATQSWASLSPSQRYGRTSLRYWLVNQVVSTATTLSSLERKAMLRTAAFLTRRSYLEEPPEDRHAFFSLLCEAAVSRDPASAGAAVAAVELIDLLTEEFMAPSLPAAAAALDREMLVTARARFAAPQGDLVRLLRAAVGAMSTLLSTPARSALASPQFSVRASPALSAVFRVLATDISELQISTAAEASLDLYADVDGGESEGLDTVVITTFNGDEWRDVVEQIPDILRICFRITRIFLASTPTEEVPDVVLKAMQIVTAVAAVSKDSYNTADDARLLLTSLMDGVLEQKWGSAPLGVVRLSYAEVWRRVLCAHGLSNVERAGRSYLGTFTKDTCSELDAAYVRLAQADADEEAFSMDVADMLLESWANLALQGDDGCSGTEHPLAGPIGQVMFHFTRMSLRSMGDAAAQYTSTSNTDAEEDHGYEDMSVTNSRLAEAAILIRFVLDKMAQTVANLLLEVAEKVFEWNSAHAPQTNIPLDVFQEDLYFLVRLTAAILADEAKGEQPSIPVQFLPAQVGHTMTNGHRKPLWHAEVLLSALFNVSQGESNLLERRGVQCEEASPRVGAAIMNALARVTRTYLVPVNVSSTGATFEAIGDPSLAAHGRNGCCTKALEGISRRGFESDVAESASKLLSTLAAGASSYNDVRESATWHTLLRAGAGAYQTLPPEAVQLVGKSLTAVLGDVVAESLLVPAYESLQVFASLRDSSPDAAERAIATLNLLRGAAQCENIGLQTRQALLLSIRAPGGVAAGCAQSFGKLRPDVARALIKLTDDIVCTMLPILSEQDSRDLLTNAVTIVKLHTDIVSSVLSETTLDELSCDIEEIVSLLSRILDEETDIDVGEACFYGLSTVLPIMTEATLTLPAVSAGFFRFTARLVSHHPKKLVLLPPGFCKEVLKTIDMQRTSVEMGSERRSLEAIAALARTRIMASENGPSSAVVDNALLGFLKSIFHGVASGSDHTSNLDAAADALLPLIYVPYGTTSTAFEELGHALLESSGNNFSMRSAIQELAHAASLAGAAHKFQEGGSVVGNARGERAARLQASKAFREALGKFSTTARGCLLSIAIGSQSA